MAAENAQEDFVLLPKPCVALYGAAANAAGRLANLVELTASNRHYMVLVELPQVQFSHNEVKWNVNNDGVVTIDGHISPAAIFADKPLIGNRRNRVQICPTEPWTISFSFPGLVDGSTAQASFTTNNFMEILVMKRNPEAETSSTGLMGLADPGLVPDSNLGQDGDISDSLSEIIDMLKELLE